MIACFLDQIDEDSPDNAQENLKDTSGALWEFHLSVQEWAALSHRVTIKLGQLYTHLHVMVCRFFIDRMS